MPAQFDAVAEAQNGFSLLFKNWILAIPTAIVSLLETIILFTALGAMMAAIASGGMGAGGLAAGLGAFSGITGLLFIVVLLAGLVAHASVMYAARDAWNNRPPDLAAGMARGLSCFLNLLIAAILIGLMMVVATIIPVLGWLVIGFLSMFTFPAIVLGGESGVTAIGTSFKLATANFSQALIGFLAVIVVVIIGSIVNRLFLTMIGLNFIVGLVVGGLIYAYAAIIVGRFYTLLAAGTPVAVPVTAPPSSMQPPPSMPPPSSPPPPMMPPPPSQ